MRWCSSLFGLQGEVLLPVLLMFCLGGFGLTLGCSSSDGNGSSSPASIEIRDLGTVTLGPNVSSQEFTVDVRGTSFMLIAEGDFASDIDIHSVIDPAGNILVTADRNDVDPIGRNNLQLPDDSVAVGLFPHTPAYQIRPGLYRFKVHNAGSGTQTIKVSAILNNRVNPTGGTLKVNLVFCGIPGISSATAFNGQTLDSQHFLTAFNEFKRIYALANIQVEVAGRFDCPAEDAERLTFLSPEDVNANGHPDDVEDLAQLTMAYPKDAVTYFLVQDADGLAGVSGGIPGPALTPGTLRSGVAVSTSGPLGIYSTERARNLGQTMAHEGGHYLGLFHTTERDALLTDPVHDTPMCPVSRDADHDGVVTATECLGLDETNLMFWGPPAPGMSHDRLTEGQKFVLHRNPLIH